MKTSDEMFKNIVMPGVTVKSRALFTGLDTPKSSTDPASKHYDNPRNVPPPKDIPNVLYPQKGFYTWLSSPKTINNNRKVNNVAVIAPTQHHP